MKPVPDVEDARASEKSDARGPGLARLAVGSSTLASLSLVMFLLLFGALWGPVYVGGTEGSLFLFPVILLLVAPVYLLALAAIVSGIVCVVHDTVRNRRPSAHALVGLIGGSIVVLIALPALWFGNAPLTLFGA